jgi:hypothetical protein
MRFSHQEYGEASYHAPTHIVFKHRLQAEEDPSSSLKERSHFRLKQPDKIGIREFELVGNVETDNALRVEVTAKLT